MRREARYVRRRRTAGASILCLVLAAVVAIVVTAGGGGGGARHPPVAGRRIATRRAVVHNGPRGTEPVPILIYHVILAAPPGAPFPGLYVTPALFAAQMHALAAAGYHAVTMDEMWNNWQHGTPLPRGKPIVISFDNGYATQYTAALPVMRSLGW